ncbi:MAG: NVEALA domain-containing protein [Bacteroidales bacterium]|nr:NVEALA domain-containing protein [Bacteroidales bacterium]
MKKIIFTASGLLFAASIYIGINIYKDSTSFDNIMLANVEAIAQTELPNNTGPAVMVYCEEGPILYGNYCKAEGGSGCQNLPCQRDGGYILI